MRMSSDAPKKEGGTLEGWYQKNFTHKSGAKQISIVFGHIFGDGRWRDGQQMRTSPIVNISEEDRILETEYTIYRLGKPADENDIASIGSVCYDVPSGPDDLEINDVDPPEPKPLTEREKEIMQAMIF